MTEGRTVEVDIMTLFGQIDAKLDKLPAQIALKADTASLERLQDKFTLLNDRISNLGWRVAFAMGSAILAFGGTVVMAILKFR